MVSGSHRIRITRVAAIAGLLIVLAWPAHAWWHWAQVSYHHKQYMRYWAGSLSNGFSFAQLPIVERFVDDPAADGMTEQWEEELGRRHINALIRLGALDFQFNEMKHLRTGTREGLHFLRFAMGHTPEGVIWLGNCPKESEPAEPVRFRVWMEPSKAAEWRSLIAKYDVPNYWEIRDQSVRLRDPESEEI